MIANQIKWDIRFLEIAKIVSQWSKDPSTKCGAVIVRPDRTIVSTGYNGFPTGCCDSDEKYSNRELKYSRIIHAEVNAILNCRENLEGYTMYTYPRGYAPTCDRCAATVIESGIKRVVHYHGDSDFAQRWKTMFDSALQMYSEAGIEIVQYNEDNNELK